MLAWSGMQSFPLPVTMLLWSAMSLGLASALVAAWGRYRDLPAWLTGPETCRLEGGGCQALFRTPRAALLGVPNALLAAAFYPLLAWGLLAGWDRRLLLGGASLALAMSVFLAWSLLSRKLQCRICWAGHWANLAVWGILLWRFQVS